MTVLLQTGLATAWLCGCLLLGSVAQAQAPSAVLRGRVTDAATGRALPYASVGVLGRPVGTVADAQGRFTLAVPAQYDADSLRVALVGYRPHATTVRTFRARACPPEAGCAVALAAAPQTALREVVVRAGKAVPRVLGNSGNSGIVAWEFSANQLGDQVGQRIRARHLSYLEEVSFHISQCTYDSLFFRVNVYRLDAQGLPGANRLPEPVYVRVAKGNGRNQKRLSVDLRPFQLWLQAGEAVAVCLELVKDLGPGRLYFSGSLLGGPCYAYERSISPRWDLITTVGVSIDATVTEYR